MPGDRRPVPTHRDEQGTTQVCLHTVEASRPVHNAQGHVLELDKKAPSPLLYHLGFIVRLEEGGLPSWRQSQEVSSSSPSHALILLHVIPTYKSPYGGARVAQTNGPHMPEWSGGTLAGTQ
jgi:hypothetical protein